MNRRKKPAAGRPVPTRRKVILWLCALLVVLSGSFGIYEFGRQSGWWGESDSLRILLADPMASSDLLNFKLLRAEQSKAPGFMHKATPSYVARWFSPNNKNLDDARNEFTRLAEQKGWVYDPDSSTERYWNGRKTDIRGYTMSISIGTVKDDGYELSSHRTSNEAIAILINYL